MLEIVFSEIAAGSLIYAQHMGEGEYVGGSNGGALDIEGWPSLASVSSKNRSEYEEENRKKWENATPLGGTFSDVFCFPDNYSIGPLSDWRPSAPSERMSSLKIAFSQAHWDEARWFRTAEVTAENLARLVQTMRSEEETGLRVWTSRIPQEWCGLCWLMDTLRTRLRALPEVEIIELPRYLPAGDGWRVCDGWEGIAPEEYYGLQRLSRRFTPEDIARASQEWRRMEHQNGLLRAVVSGTLVTVPETFYDSFIMAEIAKNAEDFRENDLIYNVIDTYDLGIGDEWLTYRIDRFIEDGRLKAISTASDAAILYSRMLAKGPAFPVAAPSSAPAVSPLRPDMSL